MSSKKEKATSLPQIENDTAPSLDRNASRNRTKFLIEEYKSLRREIDIYLKETRSLERYLILATGAVWGWLLVNHNVSKIAWSIPIVLTVGIGIRSLVMVGHFKDLGSYLSQTEEQFGVKGWEHRQVTPWLVISNTVIWLALLIIACLGYQSRQDIVRSAEQSQAATANPESPKPSSAEKSNAETATPHSKH